MRRIIAHRGASDHAAENTLAAFRLADRLGADYWELDVHLSADGVPVVVHDADLGRLTGQPGQVASLSAAEITARHVDGVPIPDFAAVAALAADLDAGLYVELKAPGTAAPVAEILARSGVERAVLGSFDARILRQARAVCGRRYPLALLVTLGDDPFAAAAASQAAPELLHLCWEKGGAAPQDLVTPQLLARARAQGYEIVLWHEERPAVVAALQRLPVWGVCTNRPEMFARHRPHPDNPIEIVCHRGANFLAPENTLPAAEIAHGLGAHLVELDVRTTRDGALVVIHDVRLDRTTDGRGPVARRSLVQCRALDAGAWFAPRYRGVGLPTLAEMLDQARHGCGLYIEIKDADPGAVVALVRGRGLMDRCLFWDEDQDRLATLAGLGGDVRIMARWQDIADLDQARMRFNARIIEVTARESTARTFAAIRAAGMAVMVCYLGADPAVMRRLIGLKPDLFNLDRPDVFRRVYAARYRFASQAPS